jgi:multiple sugar transport system substrate-binding protein
MGRLKRIIATALTAMTLTTAFVGCGSNSNNGEKTQDVKEKVQSKPVEIEFWYGLGNKLGENMEDFINKFNESQDKYIVKGVAQGSYPETFQALQAGIAAKKAPACVLLTAEQMYGLGERKLLAPLDELIQKDNNFNREDFMSAFINQGVIDNKLYSLPSYGTTQVLYYRKDIFEENGISSEQLDTWEGLAEVAKKLTKEENGETVFYGWEPMWGNGNLIDAVLSRGGKILSDDGKKVLIDSKEWIETWESFRKWIHEDKIMRIHYGGQGWEYWYKTIDDVMEGRAAGYIGSSGDQGDLDFTKIAAHEQPAWEGYEAKPKAEAITLSIPAITSEEEKEAAFAWMKFFTNSKNTGEWSKTTGYIAVRKSASEDPDYKAYLEENPQANIPMKQASYGSPVFIDPTGGKILDALSKAADKVEIENVPAAEALKQAKKEAQKALDKALSK